MQISLRPGQVFLKGTIIFTMPGKMKPLAKIGFSIPAEFAFPAGNGRIHRYSLPVMVRARVFHNTAELMPQYQGPGKPCISNARTPKPV
jgi:hypothetical protein